MENNKPPRQEGVPLREYIERRLDDLEKAVNLQFTLNSKALDKAYERMEERLDKMVVEINTLTNFQSTLEGKASASAVYIGYGIAGLSLIIAAISLVVRFK